MKTKIIPQIQDIELKGGPLSLSRFYLHDSVLLTFPNARDIFRDNTLGSDFPISYSIAPLSPGEYRILARADQILIAAVDRVGLMYALFTLSELGLQNDGELEEFDAFDKPSVAYRAYSDDISRGLVPTTDNLYRTIRGLARYKYNVYLPYMEDTFRYESVPGWGRYSDPIGKEEWKSIIAYAKEWNVSVRPIINLLGHFDKLKYLEDFQPLALRNKDGSLSDVMDPRKPEVRVLIRKLLDEITDCFGPGAVHCGGDEPAALTEVCGRQEAARLYQEHFTFVSNELKKRGCTMMLYADFFAPPWGDYAVPVGKIRDLPPETDFVFWDYAPRAEYPMLEAVRRQGVNVFISPAVRSYSRFSCDCKITFSNIRDLTRADAGKSKGFILSAWADGGTTLREYAWPGIAMGGNFAWRADSKYEYADCAELFHKSFFGFSPDQAALLEAVYHYDDVLQIDENLPLHDELFRSPFEPVRFKDYENISILQAVVKKAAVDLASLEPLRSRDVFEALMLTVQRVAFTADKIAALPKSELKTVEQAIPYAERAFRLAGEAAALRELHRKLWHVSNRESGWPGLEARYDDLEAQLLSFARNARLPQYFRIKQK